LETEQGCHFSEEPVKSHGPFRNPEVASSS
jgi:hypothetical protein